MRDIKFRGKRVHNGEWVYGDLVQSSRNAFNEVIATGIANPDFYPIEVHPESVGQFTGLLDKNGKEIYEADIEKGKHGNKVIVFDEISLCFVCVWTEYYDKYKQVGLVNSGCTYTKITKNSKIEIIGNIYEHPELLK